MNTIHTHSVGIMRKNKQKRKIKNKKHAHIKAKKEKKNPIFNRNTGYDYLTSGCETFFL